MILSNFENICLFFYAILRKEIIYRNPYLSKGDQCKLQSHYEVIMNPKRYPPGLAAAIYYNRRAAAVRAIIEHQAPVVFDAGCGYGTESFLFAALGAKVLAVDISPEQISIAQKRKLYFEHEIFHKKLDIDFEISDLNRYVPREQNISLTWIASVLASIANQDDFLRRVYTGTRPGGYIMVTDMNLLNPLFLFKEWRRRQRAKTTCPEFARQADFWAMVRRKRRSGARFFPRSVQGLFDDVQFFTAGTMNALLRQTGFRIYQTTFSGFLPPILFANPFTLLESLISRIPLLKELGYFYLITGFK